MLGMPYEWASVQMPLNVMDVHYRSFQRQVLPVLLQRNIGVLAMKSLGGTGVIVTKAGIPVEDALRYVLSLPISTLVSGIDSEKVLDQNLKIVREFQPLTAEEKAAIEAKTLAMAGDGRFELFKSSKHVRRPGASQAARVRHAGRLNGSGPRRASISVTPATPSARGRRRRSTARRGRCAGR